MAITPVSAVHNVRSPNGVYHQRKLFYRHLKKAVEKGNARRPFRTGTVKTASDVRSAYSEPIRNNPDFRVSISQSARNRMAHSDVIDLVPSIASDQTVVFESLLFST